MKNLIFTGICAAILTSCTTQKNLNNPLIGSWSSDFNGCTETYVFKNDGTRTYVSNEEKGTSKYEITKLTDTTYKLTDIITESNGGNDCFGEPGSPVGHKVTLYIKLNAQKTEMTMCADAQFNKCIQPFYKK